jgi:DNA-binding ferritin-like protein
MAASKRKVAAKKKAAKSAKPKVAAKKKAVKKATKKKAAKKKVAVVPKVSPAVADLDRRIAILRNNLRDLAEMATASAGASTEELTSSRIADHEEQLRNLIQQRDALAKRKG